MPQKRRANVITAGGPQGVVPGSDWAPLQPPIECGLPAVPARSRDRSPGASAMDWQPLIEAARSAREHSYCPYSRFAVGAAVLTQSGRVFAGCNLENRSYGMTICAERAAIAAANSAGDRELVAVVVLADASPPARPCGLCLDTLAEFNPQIEVLLINLQGEREAMPLSRLLPQPFRFRPR